jgi:high-affinity Fe2+/Pb2+ permease
MTSDVGKLVSTQIELAKLEIKDEVAQAGKGAGMVGGGGLAGFVAVLLLSFAIAYWLADGLDNLGWGFFIVGIVYAAIAAVLVLKGKQKITSATPVAEQTIETIKEDVAWARRQTS